MNAKPQGGRRRSRFTTASALRIPDDPLDLLPSAGAAPDFPRIPSIWSFLGNTRDRTADHRKQSLLVSAATGRSALALRRSRPVG
ncbi:unnamed protein product [Pleuronectes platessa]|uniref:Uncharacterized protein n=1 Tax=Pleuronectes platessa TaxID=8262 RepID=A0A9N7UUZ2_PLEPL|nr:unnamed protein product [Pleuronectes platessa]